MHQSRIVRVFALVAILLVGLVFVAQISADSHSVLAPGVQAAVADPPPPPALSKGMDFACLGLVLSGLMFLLIRPRRRVVSTAVKKG